ncbi:MAG TPA: response regulator [Candidatus Aquilonibacter sp.]|nr:response regulator [Candidatus Aquilonibacter sp.]
MSDSATLTAARVPTVYFIDDSATMREVMKIAFRKENVQVITCPDAATALAQFSEAAPDAVITDVIMPDKDGYEVCDFIKNHEQFGKTPVILMSGVVNKTVAEKAMSVKADELIRKPFHPQDLIGRVKGLLAAKFPAAAILAVNPSKSAPVAAPAASAHALTNFFGAPPAAEGRPVVPAASGGVRTGAPVSFAPAPNPMVQRPANAVPGTSAAEVQKLRNEIRRLELLVKKLQAELEAEHEYCRSLEAHVKTLQE